MSEILKVLNRKSVELKSEVVEFNAVKDLEESVRKVNDLKKETSKMDSKSNTTQKEFISARKGLEELEKLYLQSRKDGDTLNASLNKNFNSLSKAAKELGVDITSLPSYKDYLKAKDNLKEVSTIAQDSWNKVYKNKL